MNRDEQHLWYLGLANYIYAGLMALAGCFPLIHLSIGIAMLSGALPPPQTPPGGGPAPPMELIGGLFAGIASLLIVVMWLHAALTAFAGYCLRCHRWYTFCFVMACIECMNAPIGTAIGVLTIIQLVKPESRVLFGVEPPPKQPPQFYG
jgi:hypothetical protein